MKSQEDQAYKFTQLVYTKLHKYSNNRALSEILLETLAVDTILFLVSILL